MSFRVSRYDIPSLGPLSLLLYSQHGNSVLVRSYRPLEGKRVAVVVVQGGVVLAEPERWSDRYYYVKPLRTLVVHEDDLEPIE